MAICFFNVQIAIFVCIVNAFFMLNGSENIDILKKKQVLWNILVNHIAGNTSNQKHKEHCLSQKRKFNCWLHWELTVVNQTFNSIQFGQNLENKSFSANFPLFSPPHLLPLISSLFPPFFLIQKGRGEDLTPLPKLCFLLARSKLYISYINRCLIT